MLHRIPGAFGRAIARAVGGPQATTENNVPVWDAVTRVLKNGLPIGTGANNLVQLDATGKLPAINGSQLTNLPAGTEASQVDQEAATNGTNYVSPRRQHFHPSAVKAWVKVNAAGTILKSYNVSSVSVGSGSVTVTFTNALDSADYAAVASPLQIPGGTSATTRFTHIQSQSATDVVVWTGDGGYGGANPSAWLIIICGDMP